MGFSPRGISWPRLILQICVADRLPEQAEHGDDLSFVMEGVREDVMQYERGTAQGTSPIVGTAGEFGVELRLGELIEIRIRFRHDSRLGFANLFGGRIFLVLQLFHWKILEPADPALLTAKDMDQLITNASHAKARKLRHELLGGQCVGMIEKKIEPLMGPTMQSTNAGVGKHFFNIQRARP
jgi:hypothetical protein